MSKIDNHPLGKATHREPPPAKITGGSNHPVGHVSRPAPTIKVTGGADHPTGRATHREPPAAKPTGGSGHFLGRATKR
jgi:hypothetical protein